MSVLREIGAVLGFAAFGGLAVLAFLTFQQARHLRRLREWAGRSPERAAAEAEAVSEADAASPATADRPPEPRGPTRRERLREEVAVRFEQFDRRSPVDSRILAAGLLAVLLGVAIATSGFGLVGGGSDDSAADSSESPTPAPKVEVAVLNGTSDASGMPVPGIADRVSRDVESSGYEIGAVENAPGPFPASVVLFGDGTKADAKALAADLEPLLGETALEPLTPAVEAVIGNAELALVVGQDDQEI